MKDQFDEYFKSNREELDHIEPPRDMIWNGIESGIQAQKNGFKLKIWRIAAIAMAFLAIGQFAYIMSQNSLKTDHSMIASGQRGAFESLEASYESEVSSLQRRVAEKQIDRSQYAVLFEELDYIDQIETEFKGDVPLTNNREKLAAILIDTYEKKIMLLERLLQQIDRDEKQKEQLEKNWVPLNNSTKSLSL